MTYEPLHHKYRPQTFAELVGQEAIAQTLTSAILQDRIAPAYLFTGPRGTGKTSSARIFAKSLNCISTDVPTATPCGKCNVCREIARGATLDVIEIDAASNTGVDNIRDLIERAQFAPAQCRYKVYVIDECLTGDSEVQTSEGLIRIDNPNIKGKQVLSYNETSKIWEFKKVLRWLYRGEKQTLIIKTANREIRCTGNHLIRTEQGWIPAKEVKEGAKILSPVNVAAVQSFINLDRTDACGDLPEDISCALKPAENGWQTLNSIQSLQWITNLEKVESVKVVGVEKVYDIEVEDNHNFVANGLLVHNCHMLSNQAFNSLLKTLEEPPDRVVFVLATTDPQRVLPTIISRCQRFDFRRIPLESMTAHLHKIAKLENINIAAEAVQMVAQIAQGGLRDAESLLDQLSLYPHQITVETVWDLVGAVPEHDLMALVEFFAKDEPTAVINLAREIVDRGREPLILLQNLTSFYRDLLIAKTAPKRSDLVALTAQTWEKLCSFARDCEVELILAAQKHLQTHEAQIKNTTQPRLWLEVTLLGLLRSALISQIHPPQPPLTKGGSFTTQTPVNSGGNSTTQPPVNSGNSTVQPPVATEGNSIGQPPVSQGESQTSNTEKFSVPNSQNPAPNSPPIPNSHPAPELTAETNNSPANSASATELDRVWEQVLTRVQPFSTQVLLRQHGNLVIFSNNTAYVKIKSQKLLNMVKDKVANIEAAFLQIFNQQVSVKMGLTNPAETNSNRAQDVPTLNRRIVENSGNLDGQAQKSPSPQIPEDLSGKAGGDRKQPAAPENSPAKVPPVPEPVAQAKRAIAPQKYAESQILGLRADAQEVANAAQQLVDMFDGEIIDFSDELEPWEATSFGLKTEADFPELSSELEPDDFIDW